MSSDSFATDFFVFNVEFQVKFYVGKVDFNKAIYWDTRLQHEKRLFKKKEDVT